ncbi:hypothetical protein [Sulfurirhabdus autotrophica]|uniref:Lipoprotein n=1 Tax=Sulfurirhabdus autotrophica TaxID=1706046 RepID=A0A4R3Y7A0_9PROT|nr:hypothetical protein [Sulfurirhabdus autotrophica]TCV86778.1 hypothetical protein EDC63_106139 [Sulfurirhabdus autotrophica]
MTRRLAIIILTAVSLTACTSTPKHPAAKGPASPDFKFNSLAKSDIDMVAEIHQQESLSHLRVLMEKLYRRNPREFKKSGQPNIESAVARVFDSPHNWNFPELHGKKSIESIYLTFQEDYKNDRVLALIAGLACMIITSYNDKTEFFLLDSLDPQKLYNSARNVEIAVWKLGNTRNSQGELFLLSNDAGGGIRNLSFEREFGKIIAEQDSMARVISEKTNRSFVRVVQSLATAVFIPI